MKSCTIIISHYESLPFLRACVRQIRKYKHPEIELVIAVADQSSDDTHNKILELYYDSDVWPVVHLEPLYSGYGIDQMFRLGYIETDYVCQLHVDAFPIHKNWLYLPIKLIEENNFSFVGQLHFISKPTDTIYPPIPFFSMSPTFNVARTETYKEMSLQAGFTRFHNRPQSGLTFLNDDWEQWAKQDYNARGSDDDVVAFAWEGNYRNTDKLGLSITGIMGIEGEEGGYGRIIDDIVFHFGFACESKGVMEHMGDKYKEWTRRINEGFDEALIDEMVNEARMRPTNATRSIWDGKLKTNFPPSESLNKRIEELKNGMD